MRRYCFKLMPLLALAAFAAACAPVPSAVVIAGQALDGVSYAATGKSGTDHVISVAMSEDCALHRILTKDPVCRSETDRQTASLIDGGEILPAGAADLAGLRPLPVPATGFAPVTAPQTASLAGDDLPADAAPKATKESFIDPMATWAPVMRRTFVVVATYDKRVEAERASHAIYNVPGHPLLRPKVVSTLNDKRPVYRLVVGPLDKDGGDALKQTLSSKGYASAAAMPGCDGAVSMACVDAN
jgi:hypothetical protein